MPRFRGLSWIFFAIPFQWNQPLQEAFKAAVAMAATKHCSETDDCRSTPTRYTAYFSAFAIFPFTFLFRLFLLSFICFVHFKICYCFEIMTNTVIDVLLPIAKEAKF